MNLTDSARVLWGIEKVKLMGEYRTEERSTQRGMQYAIFIIDVSDICSVILCYTMAVLQIQL